MLHIDNRSRGGGGEGGGRGQEGSMSCVCLGKCIMLEKVGGHLYHGEEKVTWGLKLNMK